MIFTVFLLLPNLSIGSLSSCLIKYFIKVGMEYLLFIEITHSCLSVKLDFVSIFIQYWGRNKATCPVSDGSKKRENLLLRIPTL